MCVRVDTPKPRPHKRTVTTEAEYLNRVAPELEALVVALDELGADFETELANDIITIEFDNGPDYIINSHRAARQIWMAAERQAWHFDFRAEAAEWRSDKGEEELWAALSQVLSKKLGRTVALTRPASLARD